MFMKSAVDVFSSYSGLKPNPRKSEIFLTGGYSPHADQILQAWGLTLGTLPVRYLGVPLIAGRLSTRDCRSLIHSIRNKAQSCANKTLSFAGRLLLIKYVLGLGVKDLRVWNRALMLKHIWDANLECVMQESSWTIPQNLISYLQGIVFSIIHGGSDGCTWTLEKSGQFSSSSAWEALKKKKLPVQWIMPTKFHHVLKKTNESCIPQETHHLDVLFKQALGLIPNPQTNEQPNGFVTKASKNKTLVELEEELKELVKNQRGENEGVVKGKSLYEVFTQKGSEEMKRMRVGDEEEVNVKELSSDVQRFVRYLYDEGYFRDVNFLPEMRCKIRCFEEGYARSFLKFAAERSGKDNQEIAKWLSGRELKTVALFGCPSLSRRSVFAVKGLRRFFAIAEDTAVPSSLILPSEVKACVNRLLNETIKLSKTIS
ncbi:hypothetical protein AKJ16_DCAP25787 [Drosera capensis]